MAGPLRITNCEATAAAGGSTIVVTFSEPVDGSGNYAVTPYPGDTVQNLTGTLIQNNTAAIIVADDSNLSLTQGQWIQITVAGVTPLGGGPEITSPNSVFFTQVHGDDVGVAAGDIARNTGRIARNIGSAGQAVEDIAAFSLLTEEIGYPPSPLARPSGGGGAIAPAAGGTLGQIATKAISDVLGWQAKTDPKGFQGALNASFKLEDVEGHTKAIWMPRTYAIQTELSGGGISGAQASVYKRANDALDQSLPLLDGLYPLDKEAKDEDVAALRATIRTQFTDLVNELGLLGGPRIARVTQLFFLLLGQQLPQQASDVQGFVTGQPGSGGPLQTDPDQISGSLGNLRSLFGFGKDDDQVNTVEDEQDLTNFRIVSDYVTSLAQSWLNNLQFFGLQTQTPFFGTQLVLLSRQLSVIAELVNEVRFTLDSVFIGPAERQTLQINFGSPAPGNTPPMFLEDLLTWIDSFASQEGPRLIQDGGKFAVGESFVPIGTQLETLIAGAVTPANATSLPRGYRTVRVRRSLEELRDQLQELVNLAIPIHHIASPEPEPALAVLGINPTVISQSAWPPNGSGTARSTKPAARRAAGRQPPPATAQAVSFESVPIAIIGTGFKRPGGSITGIADTRNLLHFGSVTIHSDGLASAPLILMTPAPGVGLYPLQITGVTGDTWVFGFTILPPARGDT